MCTVNMHDPWSISGFSFIVIKLESAVNVSCQVNGIEVVSLVGICRTLLAKPKFYGHYLGKCAAT